MRGLIQLGVFNEGREAALLPLLVDRIENSELRAIIDPAIKY
ncbi:hypothetical protein [Paraburkholderia youngii]